MKDQVGSCSVGFLGMKPTMKNSLSIMQISKLINPRESKKPNRRQHIRPGYYKSVKNLRSLYLQLFKTYRQNLKIFPRYAYNYLIRVSWLVNNHPKKWKLKGWETTGSVSLSTASGKVSWAFPMSAGGVSVRIDPVGQDNKAWRNQETMSSQDNVTEFC